MIAESLLTSQPLSSDYNKSSPFVNLVNVVEKLINNLLSKVKSPVNEIKAVLSLICF